MNCLCNFLKWGLLGDHPDVTICSGNHLFFFFSRFEKIWNTNQVFCVWETFDFDLIRFLLFGNMKIPNDIDFFFVDQKREKKEREFEFQIKMRQKSKSQKNKKKRKKISHWCSDKKHIAKFSWVCFFFIDLLAPGKILRVYLRVKTDGTKMRSKNVISLIKLLFTAVLVDLFDFLAVTSLKWTSSLDLSFERVDLPNCK